jgi:diguanylate cyclase (GGDEF)-like protein
MSQAVETAESMESAAAREQRTGYPWLRFADAYLEREFRDELLRSRWDFIRQGLSLGVLLIIAFGALTLLTAEQVPSAGVLWTESIIVGAILGTIAVTHLPAAVQWYPWIVQALYPVIGVVLGQIIPLDLSSRGSAQPLPALLLLVIPFVYSLLGLRLYQAMRVALGGSIAFLLLMHHSGDVPQSLTQFRMLLLGMANVSGVFMGYQLERLQRAHFLESRRLLEVAARDGLSGLFNRRRFDEHLENCWNYAQRDGKLLAVLLVDIDFFKPYNDRYGHQSGDVVLRQVAAALSRSARRPLDFVARYGGEEFAVVLFEPSREYVAEVAESIHAEVMALHIPHDASAAANQVTVSIGVAILNPTPERSSAGGLQLADEALYAAKETGRKRTVYREAEHAALATGVFRRYRKDAAAR